MTWLFSRQHTPIELPDTPTLSRLTLREWDALTETQRADYRWRIGISA